MPRRVRSRRPTRSEGRPSTAGVQKYKAIADLVYTVAKVVALCWKTLHGG